MSRLTDGASLRVCQRASSFSTAFVSSFSCTHYASLHVLMTTPVLTCQCGVANHSQLHEVHSGVDSVFLLSPHDLHVEGIHASYNTAHLCGAQVPAKGLACVYCSAYIRSHPMVGFQVNFLSILVPLITGSSQFSLSYLRVI